MATMDEARKQLSKDVGDFFESETTAAGAGDGTTLKDASLADLDEEDFLNKGRTTVFLPGSDEERRVDIDTGFTGTPADTMTLTRGFSTTVGDETTYEVHRLYSAAEKERAINAAVDLVWPEMFLPAMLKIDLVAEQMDYSVASAGFYDDIVRDVKLVSAEDTEHEVRLFNWEMQIDDATGGKKLHFYNQPHDSSRDIRVYGHKKMALANYTDGEDLLVLTARAGIYLVKRKITESAVYDRGHLAEVLSILQDDYAERLRQYRKQAIDFVAVNKVYSRRRGFNRFDIP